MKVSHFAAAFALLVICNASLSYADLFQWVDKDGVMHIVDSLKNVPDVYRGKVKVYKSTPRPEVKQSEQSGQEETAAPVKDEEKVELYGDYTLEWWKETFNKKRQELGQLQDAVAAKKQYIGLVDSGTQFGQIYGADNIDRYNKYVKELSEDEKRAQAMKDELSELVRKATIYGVPRHIRGE
ncbi:MAG: DUF4124 domain-containing protein [Deltaproteobacteria bacterium]|nr:DUF4124 domain-containing protein [Deltaproteobacteria bacterium]